MGQPLSAIGGGGASSCGSLAYLQQHQYQLHQHQLRGGGGGGGEDDESHSIRGSGGAIQLQTSLEMGPVVCPALCEIRTQLQELTRSVESCQNEVSTYRLVVDIVVDVI